MKLYMLLQTLFILYRVGLGLRLGNISACYYVIPYIPSINFQLQFAMVITIAISFYTELYTAYGTLLGIS